MFLTPRITKPKYPANLVDRLRLHQQLDGWTEKRAIAIHAPSGYGKSSLVSRWLDTSGHESRAAWLALDEDDNDPRQFIYHLVAALDRIIPGTQALILPILEDSQGSADRALKRLFSAYWEETSSDVLPGEQQTLLVLDDLHRIQSPEVDAVISTILEQGPENLHLLLLARHRTTLPIARLYAHGDILVLNAEDLRFTTGEVHEYLLSHGFPQPTEAEVAQLLERSEGWVTALQLAVAALHGRGNVTDLIDVLHGENIWLAEYLADEVLNQQTPELRRFLLQTSILDEFNNQLCVAVTGDGEAYSRLDEIGRTDLFLIPLDEKRKWFRYHHLFQELLQHRLQAQTKAGFVAELHQRAAVWLSDAGNVEAAVRHLLAAGAASQAAELVESQLHTTVWQTPYHARSLLSMLPFDLIEQRPQLMLDRCRLALLFDDERALTYTQEARRTLEEHRAWDADAARHYAEWLALNMGSSFMQRDIGAATSYAEQAQIHSALLDDIHAGLLHFMQMHLANYEGNRTQAQQSAEKALAAFVSGGFVVGEVALRRELAKWSMRSGNSAEANRRFQELFDDWSHDPLYVMRDLTIAYFPAVENSYWQNRIDQAQVYLQAAMGLAEQLQDDQLIHAARYLGETLQSDTDKVAVDLQEFSAHLAQASTPRIYDLIVDCKTRHLISAGRSDLAWQIVQKAGINLGLIATDHVHRGLVSYLRAAIAVGVDQAGVESALADALAFATENNDRLDMLQLLVLKTWQQLKAHGVQAATESLFAAAHLANETGYVRVLLDIPELVYLLKEMGISLADGTTSANGSVSTAVEAVLLTDQELRVLELLAANYSYQQIADELVISINTVRTHVRHIYRKLSVTRRDQAIYQGLRHNLLPVAMELSRSKF